MQESNEWRQYERRNTAEWYFWAAGLQQRDMIYSLIHAFMLHASPHIRMYASTLPHIHSSTHFRFLGKFHPPVHHSGKSV
jgi:hypothetical protein